MDGTNLNKGQKILGIKVLFKFLNTLYNFIKIKSVILETYIRISNRI
jgi:hypothetical protein